MRRKKRGRDRAPRTVHPNSLANLRQGVTVPPPGAQRALTHGARSELLVRDVEAEVRELMEALAEGAPVRDPDGSLPAADIVAVEVAARALKRYRHVCAWVEMHGRLDDDGNVRPAAEYEVKTGDALMRALDALGMSPMARSKLGLNIARTAQSFDLAQRWAQEGEAGDA